jgi:hypothetical protein
MEYIRDMPEEEKERLTGDDKKLNMSYEEMLDKIDSGELDLKNIGNITYI